MLSPTLPGFSFSIRLQFAIFLTPYAINTISALHAAHSTTRTLLFFGHLSSTWSLLFQLTYVLFPSFLLACIGPLKVVIFFKVCMLSECPLPPLALLASLGSMLLCFNSFVLILNVLKADRP